MFKSIDHDCRDRAVKKEMGQRFTDVYATAYKKYYCLAYHKLNNYVHQKISLVVADKTKTVSITCYKMCHTKKFNYISSPLSRISDASDSCFSSSLSVSLVSLSEPPWISCTSLSLLFPSEKVIAQLWQTYTLTVINLVPFITFSLNFSFYLDKCYITYFSYLNF